MRGRRRTVGGGGGTFLEGGALREPRLKSSVGTLPKNVVHKEKREAPGPPSPTYQKSFSRATKNRSSRQ